MLFSIIFLIFVVFLFYWNISLIISVIYGAPTVYAKDKSIQAAFELSKLKPNQTVLDLGCGNARSLIVATKNFQARGIGVEISPFYFVLAKLNVLFKGESKNIKIYFGNALAKEELIQQADVVYLYLFEKLLMRLEKIIFKNLKPGGRIVSVAFPLPGKKADLTSEVPRVFLYKG